MRNPYTRSAACQSGGFTLVELLVVIGIIAILAGVALGPISSGIRQAKESAAMQSCRAMALAEFSYSNDNANYPDGVDAGALAAQLFSGNYVSDPSVFRISGGAAKAPAGGATLAQANVDYDYLGMSIGGASPNATAGLPASTADVVPAVWSPDKEVVVPTSNAGQAFTPDGTGFFGKDGFAVAYKSNNAFFQTPQKSTAAGVYPPIGQVLVVQPGVAVDPPTGDTWKIRTGADQ